MIRTFRKLYDKTCKAKTWYDPALLDLVWFWHENIDSTNTEGHAVLHVWIQCGVYRSYQYHIICFAPQLFPPRLQELLNSSKGCSNSQAMFLGILGWENERIHNAKQNTWMGKFIGHKWIAPMMTSKCLEITFDSNTPTMSEEDFQWIRLRSRNSKASFCDGCFRA